MSKHTTTNLSVAELVQMLANATLTACRAIGHTKTYYCELRAEEYAARLAELGATIPSKQELCEMGEFNGIGAY